MAVSNTIAVGAIADPLAAESGPMARVEQELAAAVAGFPGTLGEAVRYHLASGGSRFRPRLCVSAGLRLALAPDSTVACAVACELAHNASLLHDDLQDRDRLRRGAETVWSRYGENVAICAGDLLLSAAFAALPVTSASVNVAGLFHKSIAKLICGQGEELSQEETQRTDPVTYRRIVASKSGALFALPLKLPLALAGSERFLPLADAIAGDFAMGYQIYDDLCDYQRDAARGSLNVLSVLDFPSAVETAAAALRQTVEKSPRLPHDCGALLRQQAQSLALVMARQTAAEVQCERW